MDQIKIYDVAGSAGVSLATVSRVLNHPEKVKEATRNKVLIRNIKKRPHFCGVFFLLKLKLI